MRRTIVVPELGESVLEATVGQWHKKEGDRVSVGDVVVELETDKVNLEVGAEQEGVLSKIEHQQGDTVKIGDTLGIIDGKKTDERTPEEPGTKKKDEPAGKEEKRQEKHAEKTESERLKGKEEKPEADHGRVTPLAERIAKEAGIDLGEIEGTGPGGRKTKEDVETFLKKSKEEDGGKESEKPRPSAETQRPREERIPMSRRRLTIAKRLVEAQQTAAMLTTFNEIDMSAVLNIRKKHKESFEERHGVGLGILSFFVKAGIVALRDFPRLNAEIQGNELVLKHHYDIGIAIGASEGLVVPVLRNADVMRFHEIEKNIKELSRKTDEGKLSLDDLRGGTFTITNGGVFGSLLSTPILNPPQVGILGLHKIEERPVAVDREILVRPMMYVALSYDHRIVDGREAVQFLVKIKSLIQDEGALLLES